MKTQRKKRDAIATLARQLMANSLTSQRDMMNAHNAVKTAIQIYSSVEVAINIHTDL